MRPGSSDRHACRSIIRCREPVAAISKVLMFRVDDAGMSQRKASGEWTAMIFLALLSAIAVGLVLTVFFSWAAIT